MSELFATLPVRVAVSVYVDGDLKFQERLNLEPGDLERMAARHAVAIGDQPFMVEFEFLDERNPLQRFMRFGTDKRGMVQPVALRGYPD